MDRTALFSMTSVFNVSGALHVFSYHSSGYFLRHG